MIAQKINIIKRLMDTCTIDPLELFNSPIEILFHGYMSGFLNRTYMKSRYQMNV